MNTSIVVAIDGSEQSLQGIRFAAPLARAVGAQLELVYVSPPNLLLPSIYPEAHREVERAHAAQAADVLLRGRRVATELGVASTGVRLTDGTADAVAELANAERVYGVVVGARGHNVVERVLLGSFADRLLQVCTRPVFLVR